MEEVGDILPYEVFSNLDDSEKFRLMTEWRARYKNADINKALGLSPGKFYQLLSELGVPVHKRASSKTTSEDPSDMASSPAETAPNSPHTDDQSSASPVGRTGRRGPRTQRQPQTGQVLSISLSGIYEGNVLGERLRLIASALSGEHSTYKVNIVITDSD